MQNSIGSQCLTADDVIQNSIGSQCLTAGDVIQLRRNVKKSEQHQFASCNDR